VGGRGARAGAFVGAGVWAVAAVAKTRQAATVTGRKFNFGFMLELIFGRGFRAQQKIFGNEGHWFGA
jgi:hypothetical protein